MVSFRRDGYSLWESNFSAEMRKETQVTDVLERAAKFYMLLGKNVPDMVIRRRPWGPLVSTTRDGLMTSVNGTMWLDTESNGKRRKRPTFSYVKK